MKLVIMCTICDHRGFKGQTTLPVEYESKRALIKDFMKLAVSNYKKRDYNYGKGSYFNFLGLRFEASDYYYIFTNCNNHILKTPPTVLTLEEWFNDYKTQ